ncbi:MAG: hypothetical protein WC796_00315 [Candidatus Pacearchaeota archaeon]|jgi:hypothetical protein
MLNEVAYEYILPADRNIDREGKRIYGSLDQLTNTKDTSQIPCGKPICSVRMDHRSNPHKILISSSVLTHDEIDAVVNQH